MGHQHIKYTERMNKACRFQNCSDTSFGFGTITAEMRSLNYASTCMQQALSAVKSAYSFIIHIPLSGFRKAES